MEELLLRALSASLLLAVLTGPLGCFVVWHRMAYFGDTIAHSALLGIGISLMLHVQLGTGVLLCAVVIAIVLAWLFNRYGYSLDSLLGIFAHVALAAGVVLLSFVEDNHIDWLAYLFGDLLSISWTDVQSMAVISGALLLLTFLGWRRFVLLSVNAELAEVDGLNTSLYRGLLMVLIAATIALAIKLVGVLLVTALLIIPAATARNLSRSPRQMAILAMLFGSLASLGGLTASYTIDVSTGPAIVLTAFVVFVLSLPLRS